MPAKKAPKKATKKRASSKESASKKAAGTVKRKQAKKASKKRPAAKKAAKKKETSKKASARTATVKQTDPRQPTRRTESADAKTLPFHSDGKEASTWFSNLSSGVQQNIKKLLNQISPEMRDHLIELVRTHGPAAALTFAQTQSRRAKGPKAKLAFKGLSILLTTLSASTSRK